MRRSSLLHDYDSKQRQNGDTPSCFSSSSMKTPFEEAKDTSDHDIHLAQEKRANALLVKDLYSLAFVDREKVYEDVHGVSPKIIETPDLIESSLRDMDSEIGKIHHKPAYNIAASQDLGFVQGRKLRIMFLRAERFDPKLAAVRYVAYFAWKLDIFAEELLCKDVHLKDLHPDAVANIRGGWQQILPVRDSRGRAILFCSAFRYRQHFKSPVGVWQMMFYTMMAMMEEEETQRSGIVFVMNCMGSINDVFTTNPTHPMYQTFWKNPGMFSAFPWRIEACHICYSDPKCKPMMTMMTLRTGSYIRSRMRMHYGTPTECLYALLTFGVPTTTIPLSVDGETLKTSNHGKWIKRRKAKEAWLLDHQPLHQPLEFPGIELPSNHDVLLGRGRSALEHAGNQVLHDILCRYRHEYDGAKGKGNKSVVARTVIECIQKTGGRFLRRNDKIHGWWEEVPNAVAVEKVCHGFRSKRGSYNRSMVDAVESSSSTSSARLHGQDETTHKRIKSTKNHPDLLTSESSLPNVAESEVASPVSDASDIEAEDHDPADQDTSRQNTTNLVGFVTGTQPPLPVRPSSSSQSAHSSQSEGEYDRFLFEFITNQSHCFKHSIPDVGLWMKSMDIRTINDLMEACSDPEFVESSMVINGGLKESFRDHFAKAVKLEACKSRLKKF